MLYITNLIKHTLAEELVILAVCDKYKTELTVVLKIIKTRPKLNIGIIISCFLIEY